MCCGCFERLPAPVYERLLQDYTQRKPPASHPEHCFFSADPAAFSDRYEQNGNVYLCLWIYCKKNPYQYLYDMAVSGVFHGHCAAEKGYSRCQMGSVFRGGTVCCSVCIAVKPAIVKDFLEKIKKRIP